MTQIVKFVDRPGGTVLLDVSPGAAGVQVGDTSQSFPPPPINRVTSANPAQDGGSVPSSLYGLRTVVLPLVYSAGTGGDALRRAKVQELMRVLQREDVWLEVRADGASESRFLHCYRSSDPTLIARLMGAAWAELTVTMLADPFAYGPKESLGTLTTTVAGDLKTAVLASSVKGHVDTPLMVTYTPTSDSVWRTLWVASGAGHVTGSLKCLVDLNLVGLVLPSGTTRTTTADATAVGGNYVLWASVDPGQSYEINSGTMLSNAAGSAGPPAGSYRLFLIGRNGSTQSDGERWQVDLIHTIPNGFLSAIQTPVAPPAFIAKVVAAANVPTWVDLGVVDVPFAGRQAAAGFDAATTIGALDLTLKLTLLDGNTAEDYGTDALVVLPADTSIMALMVWSNTSGRKFVVDPFTGQVLVRTSGDVNVPDMGGARAVGQAPIVSPITDTMLYACAASGPGEDPDNATTVSVLPASFLAEYWPRYLTVV